MLFFKGFIVDIKYEYKNKTDNYYRYFSRTLF